jgi:hypothetical protein
LTVPSGLRKSFFDLNAYLASTNQRIYDTYYSILEKTQALQAAVTTLGELRELSQGVNDAFSRDAAGIEQEVQQQLGALGTLEPQRRRIEALQARILSGRSRAAELGARVDAVRRRVEGWERKDADVQERSRRRAKMFWIAVLVVGLVGVVLAFGAQLYGASAGEAHAGQGGGHDNIVSAISSALAHGTPPAGEEDQLRVFDEL